MSKQKTRFVSLYGCLGTGKTVIAKKVARHLIERGYVDKIRFKDFENIKTKFTTFEKELLGQSIAQKKITYDKLKRKKYLFILDNCDDLMENNQSKFEATLNDLAQHTSAKFLIISHKKYDLKFGNYFLPLIELKELDEYYSRKMIQFYAEQSILQFTSNRDFEDLIKIMPKSPKSIWETVQKINNKIPIQKIINSLEMNKMINRERDCTEFNLQIKKLKTTNQEAYAMLLFISLFPQGISVEDLKFLEKKKQIPQNWIQIMESLTIFHNDLETDEELKSSQNERSTIQVKQDLQENKFDNDKQQEETYKFDQFKNNSYFWMLISRKSGVVVFKIQTSVVDQLKQEEYKHDLFSQEVLVLDYLSIFSRKLLDVLKSQYRHQEQLLEYSSLSTSGIFGVYSFQNQGFVEDKKITQKYYKQRKQNQETLEQILFKNLTPIELFKIHEGNFYSYLIVEDHKQMIDYINSEEEHGENKKLKIIKNIQELCLNIPSIHKFLNEERSRSEEYHQQAELILDELLVKTKNSQFLVPKSKLIFLKSSLYIERFVSQVKFCQSIEEVIQYDEINNIYDDIHKKFYDFDKNEIFIKLIDIEKQFMIFYLIFMSIKKIKEEDLSFVFESILQVPRDSRNNGIQGKVNLMLETLIPELIKQINLLSLNQKKLENDQKKLDDDQRDIKMDLNALNILKYKTHLLNELIEQEFNTQYNQNFQELKESIKMFGNLGLFSLMIQTTIVYCKKRLNSLEYSSNKQKLIRLKKGYLQKALNISTSLKLTSLVADCKKIFGQINDQLHHISSNVFQFMKSQPLMNDKQTPYGNIIRLNQSFKRKITDVFSESGKELNLKFEIQTIKHFKECLLRGSKFMCIDCDGYKDDGIIVEEDLLPLMRNYTKYEMESYYKEHYEEFSNIEILMLCTPNGIKLKDMFYRIIDKINASIEKQNNLPQKQQKRKDDNEDKDYELRRKPTIIAFQFNTKYRDENKRKVTPTTSKQDSTGDLNNTNRKSKSKRQSKQMEEIVDENIPKEYDDFYLIYLKEFAKQEFQFEFLRQLLKEKSSPNPQNHIQKAFSLAYQKMIQETIRCSEDIRDEQTFEQILGKGPELFLSDDWMDAKYDFKNGKAVDISSERPPQNLSKKYDIITGRQSDIYTILQNVQVISVNIFGTPGVGKTLVAQQIAYFSSSRNIFSDGVYYFSLKELPNFNNDLDCLMKSVLGQQFSQNTKEYFRQKKMLLIFDEFDFICEKEIQYFEHIFYYINLFDIHYILITQKSLRLQIELNNIKLNCIKPKMYYHEVKLFSKLESFNFLDSLIDLKQINKNIIFENRKKYENIYDQVQGNPKNLKKQYDRESMISYHQHNQQHFQYQNQNAYNDNFNISLNEFGSDNPFYNQQQMNDEQYNQVHQEEDENFDRRNSRGINQPNNQGITPYNNKSRFDKEINYQTKSNHKLDSKLEGTQYVNQLFSNNSLTTNIHYNNSNSQSESKTSKPNVSNQQVRQGSFSRNDSNFVQSVQIKQYEVQNIEEEEENPKSDDEFHNKVQHYSSSKSESQISNASKTTSQSVGSQQTDSYKNFNFQKTYSQGSISQKKKVYKVGKYDKFHDKKKNKYKENNSDDQIEDNED